MPGGRNSPYATPGCFAQPSHTGAASGVTAEPVASLAQTHPCYL